MRALFPAARGPSHMFKSDARLCALRTFALHWFF
jgi:hypothetical protein